MRVDRDLKLAAMPQIIGDDDHWFRQHPEEAAQYDLQTRLAAVDHLLTIHEAAVQHGVRDRSIRDAIERGTLMALPFHPPNAPPNRRNWRIRQSELTRYREETPDRPKIGEYREAVARERANGYIPISEAATMLGLSRTRIIQMCRNPHNPLTRTQIDGVWFLAKLDVQFFLEKRAFEGLFFPENAPN